MADKKRIKKAIKQPGKCTPITKSSCTGPAKVLVKRFKKWGDLYNKKK